MTPSQISHMLANHADDVCRLLLPNGRRVGKDWCCGSTNGECGSSLKVCLEGPKSGRWSDFAIDNESGDLLDLWQVTKNVTISQAMTEACEYLNIPTNPLAGEKRSYKTPATPVAACLEHVRDHKQALDYLINKRLITLATLERFNVMTRGQEIVFNYHKDDKCLFRKYLHLERSDKGKKGIQVAPECRPTLFGWQAVDDSARSIILCEGEIDAMTWKQYGFDSLSVPFGAGNHQWIEEEYDHLQRFDEIYVSFDMDEEGQKSIESICERLGKHRCRVVELPHKDANECLLELKSAGDMYECLHSAKTMDPEELKRASDFKDKVYEEFYPSDELAIGLDMPWKKTQGKIYIRPHELSMWTGINGHGKSQVMGHVAISSIMQKSKVCIASMEMRPQKTLRRMCRQIVGKGQPSPEDLEEINKWYYDSLFIFNLVGSAKSERLLEVMEYGHYRYNITHFVIDSLVKCGFAEDDYNGQKSFVDKLCDLKNQLPIHIHLLAHSRKGQDESLMPGKLDIKGTGAITDLADNVFSVWRNKIKEDAIDSGEDKLSLRDEPDAVIGCFKQREGDWEGKVGLFWDQPSYQYKESPEALAINYLRQAEGPVERQYGYNNDF